MSQYKEPDGERWRLKLRTDPSTPAASDSDMAYSKASFRSNVVSSKGWHWWLPQLLALDRAGLLRDEDLELLFRNDI